MKARLHHRIIASFYLFVFRKFGRQDALDAFSRGVERWGAPMATTLLSRAGLRLAGPGRVDRFIKVRGLQSQLWGLTPVLAIGPWPLTTLIPLLLSALLAFWYANKVSLDPSVRGDIAYTLSPAFLSDVRSLVRLVRAVPLEELRAIQLKVEDRLYEMDTPRFYVLTRAIAREFEKCPSHVRETALVLAPDFIGTISELLEVSANV